MTTFYSLSRLLEMKHERLPATPVSIKRDSSLKEALDLMARYDFSQLPVVDAHGVVAGAITTESVSRTMQQLTTESSDGQISLPNLLTCSVQGFMEKARVISDAGTDIFNLLDHFAEYSYIIVTDDDGRLKDVLTNYDVIELYGDVTEHFLLVGKIEELLRVIIRNVFSSNEELASAIAALPSVEDSDRKTQSSKQGSTNRDIDDLTLQDEQILIMKNWNRFSLYFQDRELWDKYLSRLRDIRNDLFHFRVQELQPEQKKMLQDLLSKLEEVAQP